MDSVNQDRTPYWNCMTNSVDQDRVVRIVCADGEGWDQLVFRTVMLRPTEPFPSGHFPDGGTPSRAPLLPTL